MYLKKSVKKFLPVLAVIVLALALWAGFTPPVSAYASAETAKNLGAYDYTVDRYDIQMDVSETCEVKVTEKIYVSLLGYYSHGIIRDLPLGHNVRYRDITASCDNKDFEYYTQTDDTDFLSVYLRGDRTAMGETRIYTLSYTMLLPSATNGYLPLDVVGFGMSAEMNHVTATVTLPAAPEDYRIYSGRYGTTTNACNVQAEWNGNTVTLTADELPYLYHYGHEDDGGYAGITLDLQFADGVLRGGFDFTIIYALLLATALIVAGVLVKLFVCRNPLITATVNFTAPDRMDPLKMGKYIDNSVDSEDIGAMVFWFAEQGYLTIDLSENDEDPTLIRTEKLLPPDAPVYQRILLDGLFENAAFGAEIDSKAYKFAEQGYLIIDRAEYGGSSRLIRTGKQFPIDAPDARREEFEGLFVKGKRVRSSELENHFYKSADAARQNVNDLSKHFYEKKGSAFTLLFAVLSIALLGGFALLYPMLTVFSGYLYWYLFVICAISFFVPAGCFGLAAQREFKWKRWKRLAVQIGGLALSFLVSLVSLALPNPAMGYVTCYILCASCAVTGAISGSFLCRTKEYSDALGQIVGFKNFIAVAEKDRLKYMLEENPEIYYHILPYAQVLGVSAIWEDKFKDIVDMRPPTYMTLSTSDFLFDFLVWNSVFRSMNRNFAQTMFSRPSSSGKGFNGGFGGGGGSFGGGFGGGGFGGGGMRGC